MTQSRGRARNGRGTEEVSALDKRIIEHLQEDGRRPFTQIALELGVSEAAVRARTNRLVERGILQIVGVTDPLKLGFQQMAMVGSAATRDRLVQVAEAVGAFPEVDYVVITAGTYDILIEVVCEDNSALLDFLAEKPRAIEGVRDTETFVYLRMVKQTYQFTSSAQCSQRGRCGGVDLRTAQAVAWSLRHGEHDALPKAVPQPAGAGEGE